MLGSSDIIFKNIDVFLIDFLSFVVSPWIRSYDVLSPMFFKSYVASLFSTLTTPLPFLEIKNFHSIDSLYIFQWQIF